MNNIHLKIFIFFLIFSLFYSTPEDYIEIGTLEKTQFKINGNQMSYFKYKLGKEKGYIGLHFHSANSNTVKVSIYNKPDEDDPILSYFLGLEQFKEIDVNDFNDYVYIVIMETCNYFYKDYITIFNSDETIQLKSEEVLTIKNFLSNNKYQISFTSKYNILLFYNTVNSENNKRKITIRNNDDIELNQGEESNYKVNLSPGILNIIVENFIEKDIEGEIGSQEFSLIVYEKKNKYGFKEITKNEITNNKYIYNNEKQEFYYYADISDYINSNILNFKLNFKYYLFKNNINFLTKILYLDNSIKDSDLEDQINIPKEKNFPFSYEINSDEYFGIYFKVEKTDKKYKYLLIKLEIIDNQYYIGSKNIEAFLGKQIKENDLNEIDYNKAYNMQNEIISYSTNYYKLILNPDDIYIFKSQNEQIGLYIKGDLLNNKNELNEDYLKNNNEIMIVSGIKELTVKLFDIMPNKILFYAERINSSNIEYIENKRNNEIFEIHMSEEECNNGNIKYIVGNYDHEQYAEGNIKEVEYYATIDSGDFTVYYKNNIQFEKGKNLFPLDDSESIKFNKEIKLGTNIDLFTIKCKKGGSMSIRPKRKIFSENTHLIAQNSINEIKFQHKVEIIQLTTNLGQNEGTIYLSILSLDRGKIIITPDTPGVFEQKMIQNNELFFTSIDLSKFKMDQLAISVDFSLSSGNNLEIVEIIHNKYNTYQKLKKGENKNIKINNAYIQIDSNINKFNFTLENLQNKKISYGIIKSASNDENYLTTVDKYHNVTIINKILDEKLDFEIENIYYKNKDNIKPYLFFLISILDEDDNLDYNIKINIEDSDNDDDDNDKVPLVVAFALTLSTILFLVFLSIYIYHFRNKTSDGYDKLLFNQSLAIMDKNDKSF